ncbi:hypothetical protein EV360DRAFT_90923 [Lentinula raphanica]|nr:hypothetical protein EV360DRAFT_90923 [Lentinula raphanica]
MDVDMDAYQAGLDSEAPNLSSLPPETLGAMVDYLCQKDIIEQSSGDEDNERSDNSDEESIPELETQFRNLFKPRRQRGNPDPSSHYFPWPDRETFFVIYLGALGHIYYVNDLAGIISQELSNPSIRPHLHFLPKDSGKELGEAYQAQRWLNEQDPDLLTPVHRIMNQDFYTFEPCLHQSGQMYMPIRWFSRPDRNVYAKAWLMKTIKLADGQSGWAVETYSEVEISSVHLLLSFSELQRLHSSLDCIIRKNTLGLGNCEYL